MHCALLAVRSVQGAWSLVAVGSPLKFGAMSKIINVHVYININIYIYIYIYIYIFGSK